MTYNVFGQALNLAQSISLRASWRGGGMAVLIVILANSNIQSASQFRQTRQTCAILYLRLLLIFHSFVISLLTSK